MPIEIEQDGKKVVVFTQTELDGVVAEDRRKTETKLKAQVTEKQTAYEQLQTQVADLLGGKPIEEVKTEFATTLSKLQSSEEKAKTLEIQSATRIKEAESKATAAETKFKDLAIGRALLDAALPKAVTSATANLIAKELREKATVDENGVVTLEVELVEDGAKVKKKITPEQAVEIMEKQVDQWGSLFKSGVSGGTNGKGSNVPTTPAGEVDFSKMSMPQYAEWRKANPQLAGVR